MGSGVRGNDLTPRSLLPRRSLRGAEKRPQVGSLGVGWIEKKRPEQDDLISNIWRCSRSAHISDLDSTPFSQGLGPTVLPQPETFIYLSCHPDHEFFLRLGTVSAVEFFSARFLSCSRSALTPPRVILGRKIRTPPNDLVCVLLCLWENAATQMTARSENESTV